MVLFHPLWTRRRRAARSCLSPGGIGGGEEVPNCAVHLRWACCPGNRVCVSVCVCGGGWGGAEVESWGHYLGECATSSLYTCSWRKLTLTVTVFHFQLVTQEFSRHLPRLQAWVQHGCAVVMVDNRGSANRGTQFEAHIQARCMYTPNIYI